jgi:hypothetical protein
MRFAQFTDAFGHASTDAKIESLFRELNTLRRPSLPEEDGFCFHDWVLVRRQGVELGFADSEYHTAAERFRWGHGKLLLTQVYFYSGFDDVARYSGELPFDLQWSDTQAAARQKLADFEATRHSYLTDTWEVPGYRLTVTYAGKGESIDRMVCRNLAAPIPTGPSVTPPSLNGMTAAFGHSVRSTDFADLWVDSFDAAAHSEAREENSIDWTSSFGATLSFAASSNGPLFQAITLHRNRDSESVGWRGPLPEGLDFEDSPEVLFRKISQTPVQRSNGPTTGHAVWHFDECTLHVLYSNLDNRLLRIKLISPGTWRCVEDS